MADQKETNTKGNHTTTVGQKRSMEFNSSEQKRIRSPNSTESGRNMLTLDQLNNHVRPKAAPQWYDLGVILLNADNMNIIKKNNPGDVETCCTEMFNQWLKKDTSANWITLISALRKPSLKLCALADQLYKKFVAGNSDVCEGQSWNNDATNEIAKVPATGKLMKFADIEIGFAKMTEEIQETLCTECIRVAPLIRQLRTMSAVRMRKVPLFHEKVFKKVTTINDLWEKLSKYWTIFDYDILLCVVDLSRSSNAKELLDNFLAKIDPCAFGDKLILRKQVYEDEEFKWDPLLRVKVKTEKWGSEYQIMKEVKEIISKNFDLDRYSPQFVGIKEGCIELIFHVSPATMSYMLKFKITGNNMANFAKLNIVSLQINDLKLIVPPLVADMNEVYVWTRQDTLLNLQKDHGDEIKLIASEEYEQNPVNTIVYPPSPKSKGKQTADDGDNIDTLVSQQFPMSREDVKLDTLVFMTTNVTQDKTEIDKTSEQVESKKSDLIPTIKVMDNTAASLHVQKTEWCLLLGSDNTGSLESGIREQTTVDMNSQKDKDEKQATLKIKDTTAQLGVAFVQETDISQEQVKIDLDTGRTPLKDQRKKDAIQKEMKGESTGNKKLFIKYLCIYFMVNLVTMSIVFLHQHKSPQSNVIKFLYKVGLLFYYLITFLYPLIVFAIKGEHAGYYIAYMIISLIGLLFELYHLSADLYHCVKEKYLKTNNNLSSTSILEHDQQIDKNIAQGGKYGMHKSETSISIRLGIIMIYPSIICSLYGFVNEKSWKFNSVVGGFNFAILVGSVTIDLLYEKSNLIWMIYSDFIPNFKKSATITRAILFCSVFIVSQWLILAVTGIRIFADNFARKNISMNLENITDQFENATETGDYDSTPITRYMLIAANCLPIVLFINIGFVMNSSNFVQHIQLKNSLTRKLYHMLLIAYDKLNNSNGALLRITFIYLTFLALFFLSWITSIMTCGILLDYANPTEYKLPSHTRTVTILLSFFSCLTLGASIAAISVRRNQMSRASYTKKAVEQIFEDKEQLFNSD